MNKLKEKKISILLNSSFLNYFREVVELILEAGFDINARTARGTALHDAAICGKIEVRKELCEHQIRGQRNEYSYQFLCNLKVLRDHKNHA